MAGRFLLIEFDSEEAANTLRAKIEDASRRGKGYRVVGLFARPGGDFCRCGTWTTERGKKSTLKTGKRLGWQVCTVCRKPAPIMSFLRNLLKPEDIINPTVTNVKGRDLMFHFLGISAPTRAVPQSGKK